MDLEVYQKSKLKWQIDEKGIKDLYDILRYFRNKDIQGKNVKRYVSFREDCKYEEEGEYSLSNSLLILQYAGDYNYQELQTLFGLCAIICSRDYESEYRVFQTCLNPDLAIKEDYYSLPVEKRVELRGTVGYSYSIMLFPNNLSPSLLQKIIKVGDLIMELDESLK